MILLLFIVSSAFAGNLDRHEFGFGPQVYEATRLRRGGTKQEATLGGVTGKYNRLKRYGWYWGVEGAWGEGRLEGKTGKGEAVASRFTDAWAEGRVGYTLQQKDGRQASFTPFIGGGYLWETNTFTKPKSLPLHFKTRSPYATAGFLFWMHLTYDWELGLNFQARYPWEPRSNVSHDPNHEPLTQNIRERLHYRLELPITYRLTCDGALALSLIPFYENRRYGSHPNYPYNYYKTEFRLWGTALELIYRL